MSVKLKTHPRARPLPRFVPVIFANGEEDDAPGLQAAFDNDAVQFDGRIYEPGEPIAITGRHIVLGVTVNDTTRPPGRKIHISDCYLVDARQ